MIFGTQTAEQGTSRHSTNSWWSGGEFPGGQGVAICFALQKFGTSDDVRVVLYAGGSSSDPNGATLLWESGRVDITNELEEYVRFPFNIAIPAGQVWVSFTPQGGVRGRSVGSPHHGDWDIAVRTGPSYLTGYPPTAPSGTSVNSTTQALRAYIEYTPEGGEEPEEPGVISGVTRIQQSRYFAISGANFGEVSGAVILSPTTDEGHASAEAQSTGAWADTEIAVTAAVIPGGLSPGDPIYVFVENAAGMSGPFAATVSNTGLRLPLSKDEVGTPFGAAAEVNWAISGSFGGIPASSGTTAVTDSLFQVGNFDINDVDEGDAVYLDLEVPAGGGARAKTAKMLLTAVDLTDLEAMSGPPEGD